ncbi:DEAD/DEAH box helicase [Actinokineospora auranticolor]|uniref:Superfamily II DNA/RNA helicase n=1 Tax=Actinokineospora auranticolor TaxID=155976 RepID=A0A2S6GQ98_9PSEU|nr:DEAD/DEAH box helicase [Actinokineospora auranticolor]PPK67404.1 superfamily II DNA/RNA helicase [Actinokineospora auranticolor]
MQNSALPTNDPTTEADERKPRHRQSGKGRFDGDDVTFADLGLPKPLLRALAEAGIDQPFPIQAATLPDALAGRDVLGRAQTGSGKTLAFGLALLSRLDGGTAQPLKPRGLILVPTRELALQVSDALTPLAKSLGLWCRTAVGGMSFPRQAEALRRGVDLLIATPGRLSDHVRQGTCILDGVQFSAIDEADQMADMGFLPQVREILDRTDPDGQVLLFSATLDGDVDQLVKRYLNNPVTHSVDVATASVSTMEHHMLLVSKQDKADVITEVAAREGRTIMFVRTKHHVDRLADKLRSVGVRAGALHGGKTQGARNRVLSQFREGDMPVLVATDVAARGIHVDGVSLVVHVDPPADPKDYLHRAGRTARAGEAGTVVTVVTHDQRRGVMRLTDKAGVKPEHTRVKPGDADLIRITGARVPSGEPVVEKAPPARAPRGSGHTARRTGGEFRRRTGGFEGRGARSGHPRDDRREPSRDHRDHGNRSREYAGRDDRAPRGESATREFRSDDSRGRDDRGYRPREDSRRDGFAGREERSYGNRDDRGHSRDNRDSGSRPYRERESAGSRGRESDNRASRPREFGGHDFRGRGTTESRGADRPARTRESEPRDNGNRATRRAHLTQGWRDRD